jgi:hypothetical protein
VKRRMVVAALGLAAVSGIITPGQALASSSSWYQVYQSGFTGLFRQVAAISKNNIWAVGDTFTTAGKPVYQPFIRHFNGSSWQVVTIPGATSSTSELVSASAANNVWVAGLARSPSHTAISVVYRWNGARWGKVPMPALTALTRFVVLAPDNVWAIGSSGAISDQVFHWNGAKWQGYLGTLNFIPQQISASSASNVWVSGYAWSGSKQVAAAYRWNGSAWHSAGMPHPVIDAGASVTAVAPSNVWIGYFTATRLAALHWDGHQWHTLTVPVFGNPWDIVPDGKGGYWFGSCAILSGNTWTSETMPGFTGSAGGVTPIPGTASFLISGGVETGSSATQKPTIFRFDL